AKNGVKYAEVHAEALTQALQRNIYIKIEVAKMLAEAIKELRESTDKCIQEWREESRRDRLKFEADMKKIELEAKEKEIQFTKELHEIKLDLKSEIQQTEQRVVKQLTLNMGIMMGLLTIFSTTMHIFF
ncbi:MAG: hypothetical protein AAGG80_06795, partial [Pseudomonadota bacterium]